MTELVSFVREKGFQIDFPCNGEFYRFDRGGTLNGWFVGRTYAIGEKTITVARFGDWRTGEKYVFRTDGKFTPEEQTQITRHIEESEAQEKAAREKQQLQVAEMSEARWRLAKENGLAPYLMKKGLQARGQEFTLYGCRIDADNLLVPCRDIDGKLWGLQKIQPDGGKYFTPGQKIKGCFHVIGELHEAPMPICVVEGIATGASVYLATGYPTVCAFNAGNLEAVAREIRKKFPGAQILVCGDDDKNVKRPNGQSWNPGREFATTAAKAVGGTPIFPSFQS